MKESGKMTKDVVKENMKHLMEMFMMENGKMMNSMGMEPFIILMEINTKDIGKSP